MINALLCQGDEVVDPNNLISGPTESIYQGLEKLRSQTLSGEKVPEREVEKWLEESQIREEDEVKVCELFDQYERKGRVEGEKLGIVKGKVNDILDFLRECGEVPRVLQETISKEQSIEVLKRWLKIAAKVKSIEEFQNAM